MATNGKIIERVIKIRGVKRKPLAEQADISIPTIYRILKDDPTVEVEKVARLARALRLEFDWKNEAVLVPADVPLTAINRGKDDRLRRLDRFVEKLGLSPADVVAHFTTLLSPKKRTELASIKRRGDRGAQVVTIPGSAR